MTNIIHSGITDNTPRQFHTNHAELIKEILRLESAARDIDGKGVSSILPSLSGAPEYDEITGHYIISRYLTECKEWLTDIIKAQSKTAITSPTGSGKTTFIQHLAGQVKAGNIANIDRVLLAVPLQAIAGQQGKAIPGGIPVIMAGTPVNEIDEAAHCELIICTFDSAKKLSHLVDKNCLMVIDEGHLLQQAYNYRDKALKEVWKLQSKAGKVITLTAHTPKALGRFGYKETTFSRRIEQAHPFTVYVYENGSEAGAIRHRIKTRPDGQGVTVVYLDDVDTLESYRQDLERAGYKVTIISSKDQRYKEDNPNYNSIIETGQPAENIDFILMTSIYEVGVNFLFPVREFIAINPGDPVQLAQVLKRARMVDDMNKTVPVTIYKSAKKGKGQDAARAIRKFWEPELMSLDQRLSQSVLTAQFLAQEVNEQLAFCDLDPEEISDKYSDNPDYRLIVYNDELGIFEPFAPAIMHRAWNKYLQRPFSAIVADISRAVPGFYLDDVQCVDLDKIGVSDDVKQSKEDKREAAFNQLQSNIGEYIQAVYHVTKDRELRKEIRQTFGACRTPEPDTAKFINDNRQTLASRTGQLPARRLLRLLKLARKLSTFQRITTRQAVQAVYQYQDTGQFKELCNRIAALADARKDAGPIEQIRHKHGNKIKKAIRDAGLMNTPTDAAILAEYVRKYTGDDDRSRAIMRIRELFTYERQGRKIVLTGYVTAATIADSLPALFLQKCDDDQTAQVTELHNVITDSTCTENVYNKIHVGQTNAPEPEAVPYQLNAIKQAHVSS